MKKEEKKQIYEVMILRFDQEHISVIQSDNFDSSYELWNKLSDDWQKSISERKPFRLDKPVVTSFDPSLIKEITVRPLMEVEESKYNNPYQAQMMKQGLGAMLNKGSQLLDEGYNP